ncbi:MAG: hypothetical protein ACJ77A_03695 [Actinomycetota bacterium]
MTARSRAASLIGLGLALAAVLAGTAPPAHAAADGRVAVVVLWDYPSFEEAMSAPLIRDVARSGGAGVMSVRTVEGDVGDGHDLTLGTGVRSAVPFGPWSVARRPDGSAVGLSPRYFDQILRANEGRSEPGLLGSVLEAHGLTPCAFGTRAVLVAMDRHGHTGSGSCDLRVYDLTPTFERAPPVHVVRAALDLLARDLRGLVPDSRKVLLMVVGTYPPFDSIRTRDELPPVAMATGDARRLFGAHGPMHTLTSDTTRRDGVVSNEDVAPTILRFFGIPVPSEMHGSPIEVVSDAGPPFALHRKHLENRRIATPIALGALVWVVVAGTVPILLLRRRERVPTRLGRLGTILPLTAAPLGVVLLAAGRLPTLSYANVVPVLAAVALVFAALAVGSRRYGVLWPAAGLGAVMLGYFVVDALQGWPDTPFTLLGGTALDGARFYGLPNNDIGLVLAGTLWVAAALSPWAGYCLLVAAGLFVGFPDLGANLGGALTLFAAAGLWWALRTRGRLRLRDALITGATVAVGMAAVLVSHVTLASTPTHGTRFVEHGGGAGSVARLALDRLGTGARLLIDSPLSWLVVIGLPVVLYLALRPPDVVRDGFERWPQWRAAVVTLLLAGIVAYVVNDTGVAAAGFAFGLGIAGLEYLPMMEGPWWREGRPAPAPARHPAEAST